MHVIGAGPHTMWAKRRPAWFWDPEATGGIDEVRPGLQVQVVGVGQDGLRTDRRHRLDRGVLRRSKRDSAAQEARLLGSHRYGLGLIIQGQFASRQVVRRRKRETGRA